MHADYKARPFPLNIGDYVDVCCENPITGMTYHALCCVVKKLLFANVYLTCDCFYLSELTPGDLRRAGIMYFVHEGHDTINIVDPAKVPYVGLGWKIIAKGAPVEVTVDRSGATCNSCDEFYPYAQKYENGTYVCYLCRCNPYR